MTIGSREERVLAGCDALFPQVVQFTREMVGEYAVLGHERGILELVEDRLRQLRLPVQRVPMDRARLSRSPLYAPVDWPHDDKYCLVSAIATGQPGPTLILNGHLDVVPAEQPELWSRSPKEAWEQGNWLYGRGAGDMQAGVAAMIHAVQAIRDAGYRIASSVTIQCVVEEECSGNGTLACLEQGYGGDFVLIPEPFGPILQTAQVGVLWFSIATYGRPVHVLQTARGSNAIEKLYALIPALKALERRVNARERSPPYDALEHPFNLNIGRIRGGSWPSSVPAHAQMDCRIGYPPGVTAAEVMSWVQSAVDEAVEADPILGSSPPQLAFSGFRSDGHHVDLPHPGVKLLAQCHESLTGTALGRSPLTATTDLRAFHFHSGIAGTSYGPTAESIHGIDERVDLDSVRHTLRAYALFMCRWCRLESL